MENSTETQTEEIVKPSKGDKGDWKNKLLEMDLLSPVYILIFLILFKDGVDGIDLHDAIIKFIASYNGF